jgi:GTPase
MRSGFVALVGRPNVGKSTLMNNLIGSKIAITSSKPQTTRKRIHTIYTDDRGQIVFCDTPGMIGAKNKLGTYMLDVAKKTLDSCDVILWVVEASTYIGAADKNIAAMLVTSTKPIIIAINKVDTLGDKNQIVDIIASFKGLLTEANIVGSIEALPVSAKTRKNLDELLECIYDRLEEGPMYFDEDSITDEPLRDIVAEIIREKALRYLGQEVPHGVAVTINSMKERDDGSFLVDADLICERESHKAIIIGKSGSMLKKIGTNARLDIEKVAEAHVDLRLFVKVRKNWRDDISMMKRFGYDIKSMER